MMASIWSMSISIALGVSSENTPAAIAVLSAAHLRLWLACMLPDCRMVLSVSAVLQQALVLVDEPESAVESQVFRAAAGYERAVREPER
jgi:hypothetical protein